MSAKHVQQPLQAGASGNAMTLWAYIPNVGAVIVADFNVGKVLKKDERQANARRMRACWNALLRFSTEQIERMAKEQAAPSADKGSLTASIVSTRDQDAAAPPVAG